MAVDKKAYQKEYNLKNRDKILAQRRAHYHKNKDKITEQKRKSYDYEKYKDRRLRRTYGISLDDYKEKLKEQNNCCACCGLSVEDLPSFNSQHNKKVLVVDHCHTTGKVRDLLCNRCNTVVGLCDESLFLVRLIGEYIEKHRARQK
jgi:hypothetical protein